MDQTDELSGWADRYASWVAMWQEAVRTSPLAIGLVELSTTRFVEMSRRAAELLRTTPERGAGLNYLSVTERPREATQTFRLVREHMLDGIKGRRRFHSPDGSMVELQLTGWAVRSSVGPDLGLWIADDVSEAEHATAGEEIVAPAPWSRAGPEVDGAHITLDDRWRIAHISTNALAVLGRPPVELLASSILELTHTDDLAALLLAFARATTDTSADVRIRLRQDRGWRPIRAVISLLEGDDTLPFSLVAAPDAGPDGPNPSGASQLAGHLRRIASQIEAAGLLAPLVETAAALGVPASAELSPRQWEIASRLVQGERVATIAAEMYLSQSTVRNHLSTIFQKFGVHSQPELLALWRNGAKGKSPIG
jgi:DNA-binding CsgD family transcriptional regulator/PAS domain-containing protein